MVAEPERTEATRDPTQPLTRRMRFGRMRVGGADDFAEQRERGVGEFVFFEEGVEGHVFAVMAEFAAVNVEWRRAEFGRFDRHLVDCRN